MQVTNYHGSWADVGKTKHSVIAEGDPLFAVSILHLSFLQYLRVGKSYRSPEIFRTCLGGEKHCSACIISQEWHKISSLVNSLSRFLRCPISPQAVAFLLRNSSALSFWKVRTSQSARLGCSSSWTEGKKQLVSSKGDLALGHTNNRENDKTPECSINMENSCHQSKLKCVCVGGEL